MRRFKDSEIVQSAKQSVLVTMSIMTTPYRIDKKAWIAYNGQGYLYSDRGLVSSSVLVCDF